MKTLKLILGFIFLILALMCLPPYDEKTAPKFLPDNIPAGSQPLI